MIGEVAWVVGGTPTVLLILATIRRVVARANALSTRFPRALPMFGNTFPDLQCWAHFWARSASDAQAVLDIAAQELWSHGMELKADEL